MKQHAFKTVSRDGSRIEYVFANEFAYVQVITDEHGGVMFYSVTSHHPKFRPKIWPHKLEPPTHPIPSNVRLGTVGFARIQPQETPDLIDYFISGATSPSHYLERYYFSNPGLYRTYVVGLNEAGVGFFDAISHLLKAVGPNNAQRCLVRFASEDDDDRDMETWLNEPRVAEWRRTAKPNVYGVSCEHFQRGDLPAGPHPHKLRLLND